MMMRQPGSMLWEVSVATALVALALGGAAQLLVTVARQQQRLERRQTAWREASNLLDVAMGLDYSAVNGESLAAGALSPAARDSLPAARTEFEIDESPDPPTSKRIAIRVLWRNLDGLQDQVELVAWKYAPRREAAQP